MKCQFPKLCRYGLPSMGQLSPGMRGSVVLVWVIDRAFGADSSPVSDLLDTALAFKGK
jgi:hypothetical protein